MNLISLWALWKKWQPINKAFYIEHSAFLSLIIKEKCCCSSPNPGEETEGAAIRRLKEEMGFETSLQKIFDFTYKAAFDNGLTEYEFDHVYIGYYDEEIMANKDEVNDICYLDIESIKRSLEANPEMYTAWFHIAFPLVISKIK
jgi:isopentenyl-diphosphate delta-isomerase